MNKDAKMSFNISLTKDSLFFQGTQGIRKRLNRDFPKQNAEE